MPNKDSNNSGYGEHQYNPPYYYGAPTAIEEQKVNLGKLFSTLWRYKWSVLATIAFTCALALIISSNLRPYYESEGTLLISKSNTADRSDAETNITNLLSRSYGIGTGSTINNELQVLKSRELTHKVTDKIIEERTMENGEQYPLLWRDYPTNAAMTSRDTVAMRIRNNIRFSQTDAEADVVKISFQSPSPHEAARLVNLTIDTYTDLLAEQKRAMANDATEFLDEERERVRETLATAEEELQQFMDTHDLVEVDSQTDQLITRISDLETERQNIRVSLVAVNSAIEKYEDRLESVRPGLAEQYSNAIAPKMERFQYQLAELETQRMLLLSRNPQLENNPGQSPELTRLNERITSLRTEIRTLTEQLMNESDQFLGFLGDAGGSIAENIGELHNRLIELRVEQNQYEAQLEEIDARLADQREFFESLPGNMTQLAKLRRDVAINENLYMALNDQNSEMAMWKQTQFGLGRPIDRGYVPDEPSWPPHTLFLVIGFLAGCMIAGTMVYARESMNTRIDGIEKLEKRDLPILSVIPNLKEASDNKFAQKGTFNVSGHPISNDVVTLFDFISAGTEAFRQLRNNILFSQENKNIKTITVTSSDKGEGKTTLCANLGVVLAETAKNILILDIDFRRPNAHNKFGLSQEPGIMEVLFEDAKLENTIQNTIVNGLDLLSVGRKPANPSGVIQNIGMIELLDSLKYKYEYIILDTTPYGLISDAAPLLKQADANILVSRFNQTKEAQLDQTIDKLERIGVNTIGSVLTAFNYQKSSDYSRKNYYRHAYAYEDYRSYVKD